MLHDRRLFRVNGASTDARVAPLAAGDILPAMDHQPAILTAPEAEADPRLAYARQRALDALAYARQSARLAQAWWDRDDRRQSTLQWLRSVAAQDLTGLCHVCDLARHDSWDIADQTVRELIVERLARGEDLGLQLRTYAEEIHAGYRARPIAPETDTILRAIVLASLVDRVCSRFSLTPTLRSYNPKRPLPSGCHVVALALMQESAVEKRSEEAVAAIEAAAKRAWKRYGDRSFLRSHPFLG
jgi:hypothetical protein